MAVNGKVKGANAERELAELLMRWGREVNITLDLSRNLEQSRNGGHDLNGLEKYGMAVECKRVEAMNMTSWWSQAVRQALTVKCTPVLAWRQNRQPWRFRTVAWVHPANKPLTIDLEAEQFKIWFQARLGGLQQI